MTARSFHDPGPASTGAVDPGERSWGKRKMGCLICQQIAGQSPVLSQSTTCRAWIVRVAHPRRSVSLHVIKMKSTSRAIIHRALKLHSLLYRHSSRALDVILGKREDLTQVAKQLLLFGRLASEADIAIGSDEVERRPSRSVDGLELALGMVQPLSMVDNCAFSPTGLTMRSDSPYDQEALSFSHCKQRGS